MKQQINLYSFTAAQSVWRQYSPFPQIALGVGFVLLALTVFSVMDKTQQSAQLQTLTKQHDELVGQLDQLYGLNNEPAIDELRQDVSLLEGQLEARQATMVSIKAEGAANNRGFSLHLEGLARQHFDGLWLTAIELLQGGERIGLSGFVGAPEMVPRYIGKLSNEKIFTGTEFDVFSLEQIKGTAALAFDVTTAVEAEE